LEESIVTLSDLNTCRPLNPFFTGGLPAGKDRMSEETKRTPGPWVATRFLKPDGTEIKTVGDVVEVLSASATKSENAFLYGVTTERENDHLVVCYTGNGPTSRANASFIVRACNCHDELLAACKEFVRKVECGEARSKRSYAQMKAAILKAEGE